MTYQEMEDLKQAKWMEAQQKIDIAEYLYNHCRIDDDRKYEMLQEARSIQNQAANLEKQWREQHKEDDLRAREWLEEHYEGRPY